MADAEAHCTTPFETVSVLTGQNAPESIVQQPFMQPLKPKTGIKRRIPGHIDKGGQGQLAHTGAACGIDHLPQQAAPDTLPLALPAH